MSWNLEGYNGPFDRESILEITPSHTFLLNEGSGVNISDNEGIISGIIYTKEDGMWNNS